MPSEVALLSGYSPHASGSKGVLADSHLHAAEADDVVGRRRANGVGKRAANAQQRRQRKRGERQGTFLIVRGCLWHRVHRNLTGSLIEGPAQALHA